MKDNPLVLYFLGDTTVSVLINQMNLFQTDLVCSPQELSGKKPTVTATTDDCEVHLTPLIDILGDDPISPFSTMQTDLSQIEAKIEGGERIRPEECELLFGSDLLQLGRLADQMRRRKNGKKAYYIINHHIDYSNICLLKCQFCAYGKLPNEEGAFFHNTDYFIEKLSEGLKEGITEVQIVGGLHPTLPFSYYTDLLKEIKKLSPTLHIKAFTAVEIDYFSKIFKKPVPEILKSLQEAGLDSMPGGGAEIFNQKVRDQICKEKISGERWLEVHQVAHEAGLKTNATMLYGHVETIADRIDHMERLRDLQDRTGGFLSFIPLAFNPKFTRLECLNETSGFDDLRTLAIARLYLDNFDHIKTYWVTSGIGIAQLGLSFGADDIHGTVCEEEIAHRAGSEVPQTLSVSDLKGLITEAGFEPCQRDSLYKVL